MKTFLAVILRKQKPIKIYAIYILNNLSTDRFSIELPQDFINKTNKENIVSIQRLIRARKAYAALDKGPLWKKYLPLANKSMNLSAIKQLSKRNKRDLIQNLQTLTADEIAFLHFFTKQGAEITHYTKQADTILKSGLLFSHTALNNKFGKNNFQSNSHGDTNLLGNGDNLFFRYELVHQVEFPSRFGREHIVLKAETTPLFETGWISLYEMITPFDLVK